MRLFWTVRIIFCPLTRRSAAACPRVGTLGGCCCLPHDSPSVLCRGHRERGVPASCPPPRSHRAFLRHSWHVVSCMHFRWTADEWAHAPHSLHHNDRPTICITLPSPSLVASLPPTLSVLCEVFEAVRGKITLLRIKYRVERYFICSFRFCFLLEDCSGNSVRIGGTGGTGCCIGYRNFWETNIWEQAIFEKLDGGHIFSARLASGGDGSCWARGKKEAIPRDSPGGAVCGGVTDLKT